MIARVRFVFLEKLLQIPLSFTLFKHAVVCAFCSLFAGIATPMSAQVTDKNGAIKGHIAGSYFDKKMKLFILDSVGSTQKCTKIDRKGRFSIDSIPVGRYRLRLSSTKIHFVDSPFMVVAKNSVAKAEYRVDLSCWRYDSKVAKADIVQGNVKLFLKPGGISGPIIFSNDSIFTSRYKVAYEYSGCTLPDSDDCLISYNRVVFDLLDSVYGKRWRRVIRRDVLGIRKKEH